MRKKIFFALLVIIFIGSFFTIFYFNFIHKDNKKINNSSNKYLVKRKLPKKVKMDGYITFIFKD